MNEIDNKNQRVAVFIDGSNLYFKLKSLGIKNKIKFNYRGLLEKLAGNKQIVSVGYYIGVVRAKPSDDRAMDLRKNQVKLFNHLQSHKQRMVIYRGFLMENDGVYHEKGVDVQIAVDLVVGAYEDAYDTAMVLSSDTDLLPAMQKVLSRGKGVEYVGFGHSPSLAMQTKATVSRLLVKDDLLPFESNDIKSK